MSKSSYLFGFVTLSLAAVSSFVLDAKEYCIKDSFVQNSENSFIAGNGKFLLNGSPFVIKAAELHYPRIPKEYWEHRIKMCKALGMNTICLYTFWNTHEPNEGEFNFTGQNDIREFIKLCEKNDMKVILRPGPYVCAEWEMGGLPWWLLKKKDIRLRENDPYFLERVDLFQKALANEIGDLSINKGGPIIMVQVENEYGSYGTDKEYIANIRDLLRKNFGEDITLFQCDWSSNFTNNGLDDLIWTMNFGTGANIDKQFQRLKELRPESPLMCSEFWSGWFDKWGANHETRSTEAMTAGIKEMLDKDISFSLYMTHGGTNWGHWAGANSPGYAPDVTSYDYDAPINEAGDPTPKYWALRELLEKYSDKKLPKVPPVIKKGKIEPFKLTEVAPLFQNLPESVISKDIKTMEEFNQGFGSIIYQTTLPELKNGGVLTVSDPHDFAQIFVDDKFIGMLDRRLDQKKIALPPCEKGAKLDILVEAMGRINFGRAIKDFKGITDKVTVSENRGGFEFVCDLKNWKVYNIADEYESYINRQFENVSNVAPDEYGLYPRGIYKGTFVAKSNDDTFLNFENWGKGLVYVNGKALGRIWNIGPQQSLYLPGAWLRKGENEIVIFDILGPKSLTVRGEQNPVLDKLNVDKPRKHRQNGQSLDLSEETPVLSGSFQKGNGWQSVDFSEEHEGRYLCLEALTSQENNEDAAIAEIHVIDNNGERISRENWKILYADSEDIRRNRGADKIYDLQESTFWTTEKGKSFPHSIVIDLGKEYVVNGVEYLPRMESNVPGGIKDFKIYLRKTDFKY